MKVERKEKRNLIANHSIPNRIERSSLLDNSYFPKHEEFVITELDKAKVYNDILEKGETGIVDYDKNFIYFFDENIPEIVSKMLKLEIYEPKSGEPEDGSVNEDELLKVLSKDSFKKLLISKEYSTAIDIHWPEYRRIQDSQGEVTISAYPIKRKIPFAFLNSNKVVEVDLLALIKCHSNCLDVSELVKRVKKRYREEWEKSFGSWNEKFENKKLTYIS
jgi:hypothetical protein